MRSVLSKCCPDDKQSNGLYDLRYIMYILIYTICIDFCKHYDIDAKLFFEVKETTTPDSIQKCAFTYSTKFTATAT